MKTQPVNPIEIRLVGSKYAAIDPMGITHGQAWEGESVKSFIGRIVKQFPGVEIEAVIDDSPAVKAVRELFTKG